MNLASALIEHFLNMPFQNFTEKIVGAFQIQEVLSFETGDKKRLEFIEQNTNEKIMVSIYMLDRFVNPTKGAYTTRNITKEFKTNNFDVDSQSYKLLEIPEDKAQKILCEAMREVCQIVSRNIKGYNDEMKMPNFNDEDGVESGFSR